MSGTYTNQIANLYHRKTGVQSRNSILQRDPQAGHLCTLGGITQGINKKHTRSGDCGPLKRSVLKGTLDWVKVKPQL